MRLASFLGLSVAFVSVAVVYGCSEDTVVPIIVGDGGSDASSDNGDGAVNGQDGGGSDGGSDTGGGSVVAADIRPTSASSTVTGTATFVPKPGGGATVIVDISGAAPDGLHGVHIHVNGDCGGEDAGSPGAFAGPHWDVADAGHGLPDAAAHHIGDLGNIAIVSGAGQLVVSNPDWSLAPGTPTSVVGRAVVFHAAADDGVSQPTGASGARSGCGVITVR